MVLLYLEIYIASLVRHLTARHFWIGHNIILAILYSYCMINMEEICSLHESKLERILISFITKVPG